MFPQHSAGGVATIATSHKRFVLFSLMKDFEPWPGGHLVTPQLLDRVQPVPDGDVGEPHHVEDGGGAESGRALV